METFELYQKSTIGMSLATSLDEMVMKGTLEPELAIKVLIQFDKSIAEALKRHARTQVKMKGHLHTYRNVYEVWTFMLHDASIEIEGSEEKVGRVKIVAMNSRLSTG